MVMQEVWEQVKSQKVVWGLAGVGVLLLLIGVAELHRVANAEQVVIVGETLKPEEVSQEVRMVVEFAGAVENPVVVEVEADTRVGEVLVLAGGVSDEADLNWVARNLNQAAIVRDGMKIYIPFIGEEMSEQVLGADEQIGQGMVRVNVADKDALMDLKGIGEKRAEEIVIHRPFGSIAEMVDKTTIPASVLEPLSGQLVFD